MHTSIKKFMLLLGLIGITIFGALSVAADAIPGGFYAIDKTNSASAVGYFGDNRFTAEAGVTKGGVFSADSVYSTTAFSSGMDKVEVKIRAQASGQDIVERSNTLYVSDTVSISLQLWHAAVWAEHDYTFIPLDRYTYSTKTWRCDGGMPNRSLTNEEAS